MNWNIKHTHTRTKKLTKTEQKYHCHLHPRCWTLRNSIFIVIVSHSLRNVASFVVSLCVPSWMGLSSTKRRKKKNCIDWEHWNKSGQSLLNVHCIQESGVRTSYSTISIFFNDNDDSQLTSRPQCNESYVKGHTTQKGCGRIERYTLHLNAYIFNV